MNKAKVNKLIAKLQEKAIKLSREVITFMDDLNNLDDAINLKKTEWKGKEDG